MDNPPSRFSDGLTAALPDVLRLDPDGMLTCADGSDVQAYLRAWAQAVKITQPTAVNVVLRDAEQAVRDHALLARSWAS